jgi:Acyl-CoA dehydrogenase, C-terminal domain
MFDAELAAELHRSFAAALQHDDPVAARAGLLEAGWLDALDADAAVATAITFREQGRVGRDAAALDDVLAAGLGLDDSAVAYPAAPGLHVAFSAHRHATRLVWLPDLSGDGATIVDLDGALVPAPVGGIDPAAGWLGLASRPDGTLTEVAGSQWQSALAAGRVAVAHQLVAGARALLELATNYARDRQQFGTPIAGFQAVKHRLADTLVAVSAADAATVAAAATTTVTGAAVAKALAGRAAEVAGRNCLQVFGGIGFTTEHDFHRNYRRSLALDRLLGDRCTLERELGAQLRAGALVDEHVVELDDLPRVQPV